MPRPRPRWELALEDWRECIGLTGAGAKVPKKARPAVHVPAVAIDTETTGVEWRDDAYCATVAWEDVLGRVSGHYLPFDWQEAMDALREIMLSCVEQGGIWVFHNAQFDLLKLMRLGVVKREELEPPECRFIDTQALAIFQDNLRKLKLKGKGQNNLVASVLGRDQAPEHERLAEVKKALGLKKDDGFHLLPANVVVPYAIQDAKDTYEVWRKLDKTLPERFRKHMVREMQVALALIDMSIVGFAVDVSYLEQQRDELGVRLVEADEKVRDMACQLTGKYDWTPPSQQPKKPRHEQMVLGDDSAFTRRPRTRRPFNPGSPAQLAEVLTTIGYELPLTDKGQPRTDDKVLQRCRAKTPHPFLDAIAEYRRIQKLHSTYINNILSEQVDGVLHGNFRQWGTRTGRFSSGKEDE